MRAMVRVIELKVQVMGATDGVITFAAYLMGVIVCVVWRERVGDWRDFVKDWMCRLLEGIGLGIQARSLCRSLRGHCIHLLYTQSKILSAVFQSFTSTCCWGVAHSPQPPSRPASCLGSDTPPYLPFLPPTTDDNTINAWDASAAATALHAALTTATAIGTGSRRRAPPPRSGGRLALRRPAAHRSALTALNGICKLRAGKNQKAIHARKLYFNARQLVGRCRVSIGLDLKGVQEKLQQGVYDELSHPFEGFVVDVQRLAAAWVADAEKQGIAPDVVEEWQVRGEGWA